MPNRLKFLLTAVLLGSGLVSCLADHDRETRLRIAAATGDRSAVADLLARGADIDHPDPESGMTALAAAVAHAHGDIVRLLLAHQADATIRDRDGFGVLHYAARTGSTATLEVLLRAGADPQLPSRLGRLSPLHWAAYHGQLDAAILLLATGAQVDAVTNRGETPLHLAAARGDGLMVQLLLTSGAQPDALTAAGVTPTERARRHGHPELEMLLRCPAEVDEE